MNINWEMTGVIIACVLAIIASLKWAIAGYTSYRIREQAEDFDIKGLQKRVESAEKDIKELAQANVTMVSTFHTEINKILHKMHGGSNE